MAGNAALCAKGWPGDSGDAEGVVQAVVAAARPEEYMTGTGFDRREARPPDKIYSNVRRYPRRPLPTTWIN